MSATEEIKAIKNLTSLPEWQVMKRLLVNWIRELRDVDNIDEASRSASVEAQALGRKYAARAMGDFLDEIGAIEENELKNDLSEANKWR